LIDPNDHQNLSKWLVLGSVDGDVDEYDIPAGYNLVGEKGSGTATVHIKSASIQTSM